MANRFKDQLEKTMRGDSGPLGFGRYVPATRPRLFIMAESADLKQAKTLEGVDAVFVPGQCGCKGKKSGVLKGCNGPAKDGCDFIVSDLSGAVDADPGEDTARVLSIPADLADAQLRALGGLEATAVIAAAELGQNITFRQLLSVQRLADFCGLPVILRLEKDYSKTELQALWHRGIAGIMVSEDTDTAALRQTVEQLEPKKRGKGDRMTALIQQPASAAKPDDDETYPETEPDEV